MRLLDDRKIARRYCNLKDEALDYTVWRASFERVYGPVIRQTMSWWTHPVHVSYVETCLVYGLRLNMKIQNHL